LDLAREGFAIAGNAVGSEAKYIPLIEDAARAGVAQDSDEITSIAARESQITASTTHYAAQIGQLGTRFQADSADCS
jgi:hypothetical protein